MQTGSMQCLELELKYCERCGTLRLRQSGSSQVYCPSCNEKMGKVNRGRPAARPDPVDQDKKCCQSVSQRWEFGATGNRDDRRCL